MFWICSEDKEWLRTFESRASAACICIYFCVSWDDIGAMALKITWVSWGCKCSWWHRSSWKTAAFHQADRRISGLIGVHWVLVLGLYRQRWRRGVLSEHGQCKMPNNLIFVETVIPPRGSLTTYINGDLRKNFEAFFRGVLNSAIFV